MADQVFCNRCGHGNPLGSNFCSSCGAGLEHRRGEDSTITFAHEVALEGAEEPSVDLHEIPAGVGALVVKRGRNAGSRYVLRVLEAASGNKTLAAKILGLDRKTLHRKLERWTGEKGEG